ncbi:hypothetical protein ACIBCT_35220 [Streptosporangium sp. NPDC050855]|uniref:hypothetical protein n=1 Tax=Streptosporangium sp. NPDC050855 TaxID=3366194 RepID=UPI0037B1E11A
MTELTDKSELPALVSSTLKEILQHGWTIDGLVLISEYPGPRYYISAKNVLWWLTFWVDSDGTEEWKIRNCSIVWQTIRRTKGGYLKISVADLHHVLTLSREELEMWFENRQTQEAGE